MATCWTRWAVVAILLPFAVAEWARADDGAKKPQRPVILVHYMPWYVAKPASPVWGWHWTMNVFDPEKKEPGKRSIASHYTPLIGPYDSCDPVVIEYHLLLIKLAGLDGIIVDWYGLADLYDYPVIHRNTSALFPAAAKLGLKVGICYEDQTIPKLVQAGKLAEGDRVKHVRDELAWLRKNWFADRAYLTFDGRPVLLSFGNDGLTDREWQEALPKGADAVVYLSEQRRRPGAAGAFDWPVPKDGLARADRFIAESREWPVRMPAAYPRFHDIYAEAKVPGSHVEIADDAGRTFAWTLERALKGGAPLVQVVTWNDWGEGTQVEPSVEFGYRDLEAIQRMRRQLVKPAFVPAPDDLRLAHRLYLLRHEQATRIGLEKQLDEVAGLLASGQLAGARAMLEQIDKENGSE